MSKNNLLKLTVSILICELAGIIGSLFTIPAISAWYVFLTKPSFSPPNWLFGPAWTVLYALMGVSLYLIWRKKETGKTFRLAMVLFFVHLFFNAIWSVLFFGLRNPFFALLDIIILWVLIVIIMWKFLKISRAAGYLLVPYLAWVSFAAVLNFSVWLLNR